MFDMYYMSSPQAAANTLQVSLKNMGKNIKVDGIVGSETINAVNSIENTEDINVLIDEIREERLKYLKNLPQHTKYSGWITRTKRY
mgnify:CR=1 FL=1